MKSKNITFEILKELKELYKNPKNVKDYSRFHKDHQIHLGLIASVARKYYADKFKEVKYLNKKQILEIGNELLRADKNLSRGLAFDWAYRVKKQYTADDYLFFDKWLDKYVNTWGSCDDFCTHAFGYWLFNFPERISQIHDWTKSKNQWKRRAAAVIFVYPARRDKYLSDVLKIAKSLMFDQEDLVQKGYGWMLKEASVNKQQEVYDFVMKYKNVMPRTALRYAIEKMPTSLKKQAMEKN